MGRQDDPPQGSHTHHHLFHRQRRCHRQQALFRVQVVAGSIHHELGAEELLVILPIWQGGKNPLLPGQRLIHCVEQADQVHLFPTLRLHAG
jgi:hypothetical protein